MKNSSRIPLTLLLAGALLLVVACDDPDERPPTATATPPLTATAATTAPAVMTAPRGRPLPTVTPAPPRSAPPTTRRTGIAGVDAVIDAMHADDSKTLGRVIQLSPMPCSTRGGIGPGPPGCLFGLAEGTIVHAIPMQGCEGGMASDYSAILAQLNRIAEERPELYAVYEAPEDFFGLAYAGIDLGLDYVVVFSYPGPAGQMGIGVGVRGDKAVGFKRGCATGRYAPSEMVPAGTAAVLGPL